MSVNYLIEINALDDWELTHPLSATAYKVMRKLLYLANKERFPEKITVANTVLMSLVGCSEDSLIKARNQLIQAGLLTYKGQKKATPLYMICYFSHNPVYNPKIQSMEAGIKQGYMQGYEQGLEQENKQGTIINEKEKKDEEENALSYLQKCGIALGGSQYEDIRDFYEQGITDDMLRFAADEAIDHGAVNFAYIRRVVNSWICAGIHTLEGAQARQEQYRREQEAAKTAKQARGNAAPQPTPPAPRFFTERWDEHDYAAGHCG